MPARKQIRSIRPRFRVYLGREIALGPGKADLLHAIGKTGSIQLAARSLRMSYMRAWKLIRTMNVCFRSPLVEAARGGKTKGGAHLTELGHQMLELYDQLEIQSLKATASAQKKILRELK